MIHQLVFFFSILFSLTLTPSCTIFDSSDLEESAEEEDYYEEDEDFIEEEEAAEEEPEESSLAEEEGMAPPPDEEENIYYIDEEDEELIAEEEGSIEVEEVDSDDLSTNEEEYSTADSSFFSQEVATPSSGSRGKPAPSVKKKKWISYKKIKTKPYQSGGFLVNAVYIARPGEDIRSISNKIFGSDQVQQLYAINPHLKSRNVKVGDKIYYQSPLRPQDSGQLLFYFEDNGMSPQYHQIQAGQNIRQVASQLLGHADSWKEVWATNPELNSKGLVNDAFVLKYWTGIVSPPPVSDGEELSPPPALEEETALEENTPEPALSPP
ncbi:MAG: LysM peptidoglycan-binding domain-containing protein, partial [Oligoflexia bacterium]|nr:LysM peptidoglycan-binding domain-containing protein [Oligoflexia bacterium]